MLNLSLITIGKLKETYWQGAASEYLKRLKPYVRLNIHELREEALSDKEPANFIKRKEAEKINLALTRLGPSRIIALDPAGEQPTSEMLAERLQQWHMAAEPVAWRAARA